MDTMEHATRKKIRQHPAALRQQVLMECAQPGASVARVAQFHGLNANMVHAWRRLERQASACMAARVVAVIRIDTLWLCTQPQDMRAGADRLLNIVVNTVGAAQAHHGYLFTNLRATRVKMLVHDGFGVWCATRRLHTGRFVWLQRSPGEVLAPATLQLTAQQFEALTVGLPWQRLGELSVISRC